MQQDHSVLAECDYAAAIFRQFQPSLNIVTALKDKTLHWLNIP